MKTVDLDAVAYKHRFAAAGLLISKANRLINSSAGGGSVKSRQAVIGAAIAHFDLALVLLKPFDANYSTVINWKCNALLALGQYEEACDWYREIIRLSDQTDGHATRNPTAQLAEEQLARYRNRRNKPLTPDTAGGVSFDDPPFCMLAAEFGDLLAARKFKKAHMLLTAELQETVPLAALKNSWEQMTGHARAGDITVTLEHHMIDWPDRKAEDIGWCYLSVASEEVSKGVAVVVRRNAQWIEQISELEFARP